MRAPSEALTEAEMSGYTHKDLLELSSLAIREFAKSEEHRKEVHINTLTTKGDDNPVISAACEKLATANWEILQSHPKVEFISSDNPGFLIDANGVEQNMGFNGDFTFHFPLSSDKMLVATAGSKGYNMAINVRQASFAEVIIANNLTAKFAHGLIFGRSKRVLGMVKRIP